MLSQHKEMMQHLQASLTKTADVSMQDQTQPLWESLAAKLRGTQFEAQLVDPVWAMAAIGADPKQSVKGANSG